MSTLGHSDGLHTLGGAVEVAEVDGTQVVVCRGPRMKEASRKSMGVRWCFKCRGRHEFEWIVLMPVIDWDDDASIAAAMWGPTAHSECGGCKRQAGELFPGWSYRWEDDE